MNNIIKYLLFTKYILKSLLNSKLIKNNNLTGFREELSASRGIELVDIKSITEWDNVNLTLKYLPHDEGHVSILELVILSAFASKLSDTQNVLEIGTFEGITSLNCSLNAKYSKVYTLDLPLDHSLDELQDKNYLDYDKDLINSDNRRSEILKNISNVIQLYGDSTKFDFSKTDYSMAFIDGGHDYRTVKSDTENILKYINKPGSVFWHDYDVTNDVGHYLLNISNEYDIKWIKNTRLCYLKVI
jgi:hypothetical protein